MKCPTCGQEIGRFDSDESSMKKHGECFECSIWRERLPLVGNPDIAIIDGTFYSIGDENDPSPFRGFGGDKFVIRFKDGREVTTTNLWCGGEISEYWKPQFPNNADFDWQWKKIGKYNHLVPKEENGEKVNEKLAMDLISLVANAIATGTIAEAEDYLVDKYQGSDNPLIEHSLNVMSEIFNKQTEII